jgi:hypothetical protein
VDREVLDGDDEPQVAGGDLDQVCQLQHGDAQPLSQPAHGREFIKPPSLNVASRLTDAGSPRNDGIHLFRIIKSPNTTTLVFGFTLDNPRQRTNICFIFNYLRGRSRWRWSW